MKLLRYELCFFDEPQEVGFIQGLKDQGIDDEIIDNLICDFDEKLTVPNYSDLKSIEGKYIASFFTEKGLSKFKESIDKLISFIKNQENGFSVIEKALDSVDSQDIAYSDENQVLAYIDRII